MPIRTRPRLAVALLAALAVTSTSAEAHAPSRALTGDQVVFQGPDGLALVRPDGTGLRTLAGLPRGAWHPDWSPDGRRLAYEIDDPDGTTDIWISGLDGSHLRRLVDCVAPCVFAAEPAWSPDGTRIAYWTNGDGEPQTVRVASVRTGKVLAVVDQPSDLEAGITARWSPDGRTLAVAVGRWTEDGAGGYAQTGGAIGLIDLRAARPTIRRITPYRLLAGYPSWSPDGSRITFHAGNAEPFDDPGPTSDIFVMRADGSHIRQLTHALPGGPRYFGPDWSAASDRIMLTVTRDGDVRLATIDPDGGAVSFVGGDDAATAVAGAHPRQHRFAAGRHPEGRRQPTRRSHG